MRVDNARKKTRHDNLITILFKMSLIITGLKSLETNDCFVQLIFK